MNSQGENTTASAARGFSKKAAPTTTRRLHDCACYFVSLKHTLLERITRLPFPIGPFVKCVDRWTHPLTHALEYHGLCILAAVDDKISAMGCFAEGCICGTAPQLKTVLSALYTQGVVGTSAGLWLKYEGVVKEDIQKAVCLANKVPLVNLVTPIVCAVSSPLARAISDWLLKQGRRIEKGTQTIVDNSLVILKQEAEIASPKTEFEGLSCIQAASLTNIVHDNVHFGGKTVSADDFLVSEGKILRMDDIVKHKLHLSEKDVSMDDVIPAETHTLSVQNIAEDDVHHMDASLADLFKADDGSMTAGEKIERPLLTHEGDGNLPDVLEMIESSWLLGKSSSSMKACCLPQTKLISKPRTDGLKLRIKTFFCG